MPQLTVSQAKRLARKAATKKEQWKSILKEAFELTMPNRDAFDEYVPGSDRAQTNWDGTAPASLMRAADRMLEFTPQFMDWIVLEPGPVMRMAASQDQLSQRRVLLKGAAKMCNAVLMAGGYHTSAHEMWMDWLVSTGGMIVNEGTEEGGPVITFDSMPLTHFFVETGAGGKVIRRYRWSKPECGQIMQMWKDAKLPDKLKQKIRDKPETPVSIVEIEYYDPDNAPMKWRYEVFLFAKTGDDSARLVERVDSTHSMITPRYAVMPGEALGRGPVISAMPDIRTANKIVELTFRAAAINLLGLWTAVGSDDMNPSAIRLVPGSIITVPRNGGPSGPSLQRLDSGNVSVQLAELLSEGLRENIKKSLMDNSLPPETGGVRSATELTLRMREHAMDLGGAYGRVMEEFIIPLVQRILSILNKRGWLPEDIQLDQFFTEISVSSPLAREQKLAELNDLVQWLTLLNQIGGRELLILGARIENVPEKIAELLGVDPELARPKEGQDGRDAMQQNFAATFAATGGNPLQGSNAAGSPGSALQPAA